MALLCKKGKTMKTSPMSLIASLVIGLASSSAKEKQWSPDMDYNVDRRESGSDPITSPWDFSADAQRAEYGMLYLSQADKDAVILALELEHKVGEGTLTQQQIVRLRRISGNFADVVKCEYTEVTPYFLKRANPTLLLMMLYHFEVYRHGGDADESWPSVIKPLQELDPVITAKAKELAKEGMIRRNKPAEQPGDGEAE